MLPKKESGYPWKYPIKSKRKADIIFPDKNKFISIGKISKPVGLSGYVKAIYLTDFPERFKKLNHVFLFDENRDCFYKSKDNAIEFSITDCKISDKFVTLKFKEADDIYAAEKLKGLLIMIREEDRMKISDDKFYFYEIIGAEVFDKGILLGKVEKVLNYGSGDLLCVMHNETEILIPLRKEFITSIDIRNKRIDADLTEGFY